MSPYRYEHLQTGTFYPVPRAARPIHPEDVIARKQPSEEELEKMREQQMAIMIESERKSAISSLIRLGIILIVTIPLYYVHWRLAQKYESSTRET
jgi:uncharacterized membrane protein (DUF106 family)